MNRDSAPLRRLALVGKQVHRDNRGMNKRSFEPAYRRTAYRIRSDPPLALRIDEANPALDRLLSERGVATWAFITAFNPHSQPKSEDENSAADVRLHETLAAAGYATLAADAVSDDARWPVERGWMVLGISRKRACELGREFAQNAVVWGERGAAPVLVFC